MTTFTRPSRRGAARRHAGGFTLIELMLALAVTGIIATGIATMLFAVSRGTADDSNARRQSLKLKIIRNRIQESVRGSYEVLAASNNVLVLWVVDTDGSQSPDLKEIRRIEVDPVSGNMTCYQAPSTLADSNNLAFAVDADFLAVTAALKTNPNFPGSVWATGVSSWQIQLDKPNAQDARMVSYQLTLSGTTTAMPGVVALGGQVNQ